MNRVLANRIANAVLYEGYILYPYRPSVKHRQRWTFGGLFPASYHDEPSENRTECLLRGDANTTVEVVVRFLHLTHRQVCRPDGNTVELLRVGDRVFQSWQEAEEREVAVAVQSIDILRARSHRCVFLFDAHSWSEPIRAEGALAGTLHRQQYAVAGEIEMSVVEAGADLFRLAVVTRNITQAEGAFSRDDALLRSLVSAHVLLGVNDGAFVSLFDPPAGCGDAVDACRNAGLWPVLIGEEGQTDTILAAPLILYDYPQIAPESPGDLFDGIEIDEILSLRILTLTDDEKREAAALDERTRALLERTESLGAEELARLHGTIRDRKT